MDEQPPTRQTAVNRNRLRTKIIGWLIIALIFGGVGLLLWNDLKTRGIWALLPLVVAIFFGWRVFKQAATAKNR